MDKEKMLANIPTEMQQFKQWCLYKTEEVDGCITKQIINPYNGKWACCNEPLDFGNFSFAMVQAEKYAHQGIKGVAFALTKESGITCIDIDGCLSCENEYSQTAKELLEEFSGTYIEKSMSGKGVHIFVKGNLPDGAGKKNTRNGVEMYDESRFISMTGDTLINSNVLLDCQEKLTRANEKYIRKPVALMPVKRHEATLSDSELIEKIRNSKQGNKFSYFYGGGSDKAKADGKPDYSSADFSLCLILAFWTQDEKQIDSIYRSSGLYGVPRESEKGIKWDKHIGSETYGSRTIRNALRNVTATKADSTFKKKAEYNSSKSAEQER